MSDRMSIFKDAAMPDPKGGVALRYFWLCLAAAFIPAVLSFAFFVIRDAGVLYLGEDFNMQQIPFSMAASELVRQGASYAPSMDLGTGLIGAFSFYQLGSPWFWCSVLFPPESFPWIVGILYVSKYVVASLTSFLCFRRKMDRPMAAILASMLYAFCSFQSVNLLFYHFHDVAALFPLLILGMDDLQERNRRGRLAFAVGINALVNYFFFIGEVFFLLIYFVVRYLFPVSKKSLAGLRDALAEGVLGTMIAGVLLVPSLVSIMTNTRAVGSVSGGVLAYNTVRYLAILRSALFPGDMMSAQASLYPAGEWTSCAAWLPAVGLVLVFAFVLKRWRHWLTILLAVSVVFAFVPRLNGIFCLFADWYCRWYYMPVFFAAMASGFVMDKPEDYPLRAGGIINGILLALFAGGMALYPRLTGRESLIARPSVFFVQAGIAAAGIVLTVLILRRKVYFRMLVLYAVVALTGVGTTAWMIAQYQESVSCDADQVSSTVRAAGLFTTDLGGYRLANMNDNMMTVTSGYSSQGIFCSTVSGSIYELYEALGAVREVSGISIPGMEYLVSAGYIITDEARPDEDAVEVVSDRAVTLYLYEQNKVCPIGFTYRTYMLRSEFDRLPEEQRVAAMMKTLVIPDNEEGTVADRLRPYDPVRDGAILASQSAGYAGEHQRESSREFAWNRDGFRSVIDAGKDSYAFFSVPWDRGWTASVDGEKVRIISINGLMAVPVHQGENEIVFRYHNPGLSAGLVISGAGIVGTILYAGIRSWRSAERERFLKKKEERAEERTEA